MKIAENIELVCPHCAAINRTPNERLVERPSCGSCKQQLFTGVPSELDGRQFERFITRNQLPVLVDFWAPWCGPCKAMAPEFEQVAQMLEPQILLAKVNTEAERMLAGRFQIRSIPTLILFDRGKELARSSGAMGAKQLTGWVRAHLGH